MRRSDAAKHTTQGANVGVLVLYGSDVPARITGGVELLASNIIAEANSALFTSGVPTSHFLSLAGVQATGSAFVGLTKDHVLTRMQQRSSEFAGLDQRLAEVGADIALTLISANDSSDCPGPACSAGRVGDGATPYLTAPWYGLTAPFAVVADKYALGDLTAPHEIGHLLGGGHNTGAVSPYAEADARGYVNEYYWMAMMGQFTVDAGSECPFFTLNHVPSCPRLERFSNPDLYVDGEPTGVLGISNMARALQVTMPTVAAFYAEATVVPGPVGNVTLSRSGTYQTIAWTVAAGSPSSYQLETANSPSPSTTLTYSPLYKGSAKTFTYLIKYGSYYSYGVRGCNASGCGPWTQRSTGQI